MALHLISRGPNGWVEDYPVGVGARLQIGSDMKNKIVVQDYRVRPVHATVWEEGGRLRVRPEPAGADLTVNGDRVTGDAVLQPGDRFAVGYVVLVVENPSGPTSAQQMYFKKKKQDRQELVGRLLVLLFIVGAIVGGIWLSGGFEPK